MGIVRGCAEMASTFFWSLICQTIGALKMLVLFMNNTERKTIILRNQLISVSSVSLKVDKKPLGSRVMGSGSERESKNTI